MTAFGSESEHCKVELWTTVSGAQVRCFTNAGAPVDARFTIAFLDEFQGL